MSFNQNNNETREDGVTVVHAQPQTLHTPCCKRIKFKWNSGRPNDYNELTEYQLITVYSWIFIENCDLIIQKTIIYRLLGCILDKITWKK